MASKAAVKWLLAGLAVVAAAGCQNDELTDLEASRANGAANGRGEVIAADCVVTFFSKANEGEYFSTQRHQISPVSKGIIIRAQEPQGAFTWGLSKDGYHCRIPEGAHETTPAIAIDSAVVQAIVTSFAASAGYCDLTYARPLDRVKIDGRWYEPFEAPGGEGAAKVTLYRLADEGRVDLVRVQSADSGRTVTAHSYNNHWVAGADRYVPSKIDVFAATSASGPAARILRIDYKSFHVLNKVN